MRRLPPAVVACCLLGLASAAQAQYFQQQQQSRFKFNLEAVLRQEWTDTLPFSSDSRQFGQIRPELELNFKWLDVGVGGAFNYSSDKNTENDPPLVRDNYKSRDARLDLAFARLTPASWLKLEGGRFEMPIRFTEMIWDRDLKPQGGAATLALHDSQGAEVLGVTGMWTKGSHVFDDEKTEMLSGSAQVSTAAGKDSRFTFSGSYVAWQKVDRLELMIRRQNSRGIEGTLRLDYRVVDLVARVHRGGSLESTLVADYCWNTATSIDNHGLWLALLLGSPKTARGTLEYTYAKVDKDATLAAYATDDFLWGTGWEGHRLDLGIQTGEHASLHTVGQLERFKDSPVVEDRDTYVKRLRVEVRVHGGS
jgi:hypothetical protein